MADLLEYMHEKLDRAVDMILEFLTGSSGYKVREVKVRVANPRRIVEDRLARRLPRSGPTCDRY